MASNKETENLIDRVVAVFAERIPFNNLVGFHFERHRDEDVRLVFDHREELVGNFMRGNLHGGVISSSLDVIGGLVAFISLLKKRHPGLNQEEIKRFSSLGTIDLRIDYLRPGLGESFVATGYVLRTGSKVAVTRMELHNNHHSLIAVGTGAYIVG